MIGFSYFKEDQAGLSISCVYGTDSHLWDLAIFLEIFSVSHKLFFIFIN